MRGSRGAGVEGPGSDPLPYFYLLNSHSRLGLRHPRSKQNYPIGPPTPLYSKILFEPVDLSRYIYMYMSIICCILHVHPENTYKL